MRNTHVLEQLIGKTITGVVVKAAEYPARPAQQLFLVFADDTHYEVYGELSLTGGLNPGGLAVVCEQRLGPHEILVCAGTST